jgi:DNA gyrase/topoisomerase IV subunit B
MSEESEEEKESESGKKKTQKQLKLEQELKLGKEKVKELMRRKQTTFCFETISTPGCSFQIAFIPNFNKNRQFEQVSFVNGVYTVKGGTHVNYIIEKLTKFLLPLVEKRDSKV